MNDIIFKTEDLTYLSWDDKRSSSFGTQGCFLKTSKIIDNKRVYYKLSNYDSYRGVFGHECINELITSRVSDILICKILPNEHIEKITTMITRRAEYYDEVYCKEL